MGEEGHVRPIGSTPTTTRRKTTTMTTTTIRKGPAEAPTQPTRTIGEPTSLTVHLDGKRYRVTVTVRRDPYDSRYRTARAFLSGVPDPNMWRPPYTQKGEDAAIDAAWRAYNRAELALHRQVLAAAVAGSEWRWSRTAGCSCPCSPGFRDTAHAFPANTVVSVDVRPF